MVAMPSFDVPASKYGMYALGSLSSFTACGGHASPSIISPPRFSVVLGGPIVILAGKKLPKGGVWSSRAATGGSQSLPSTKSVLLFLLLFFMLLGLLFLFMRKYCI
jgi:hypothetical protein